MSASLLAVTSIMHHACCSHTMLFACYVNQDITKSSVKDQQHCMLGKRPIARYGTSPATSFCSRRSVSRKPSSSCRSIWQQCEIEDACLQRRSKQCRPRRQHHCPQLLCPLRGASCPQGCSHQACLCTASRTACRHSCELLSGLHATSVMHVGCACA